MDLSSEDRNLGTTSGVTATATVFVSDSNSSRRDRVSQVAKSVGVPLRIVSSSTFTDLFNRSNSPAVSLVGLQAQLQDNCTEVKRLAERGFKVIAYADGASAWQIGLRCQVFLSGAQRLLDSSSEDFDDHLRSHLAVILASIKDVEERNNQIKTTARELNIVAESKEMIAVCESTLRISKLSDLPVLITGPTGCGKELFARAIHRLDPKRCEGPFVGFNCSALNSSIAESELFGHRQGAFTGAVKERKGLFRSANGGVLFMDEIAELDLPLQAKLLRVLQSNTLLPVGADSEVSVDVRVIAATNKDLPAMVMRNDFRADLYHRLNVLFVSIPPLHARHADVGPLIEYHLSRYREMRITNCRAVADDFVEAAKLLELPGNVRQLQNIVLFALSHKLDDGPLNLSDLNAEIWNELLLKNKPNVTDESTASFPSADKHEPLEFLASPLGKFLNSNNWNLVRSLQDCEKEILLAALRRTNGHQTRAAQLLGITPRSVYNKLQKHNLH